MDGKIVYQVRVDSSRVHEDLAAAGAQITGGTATLISLGKQAAERIGNALNAFFGTQNTAMSQMLSSLSGGFSKLSGAAGGAASSISPLTAGIANLLGLDLGRLLSFFNQLPSAVAGAGAALGSAAGITAALSAQTGTGAAASGSNTGAAPARSSTAPTPARYRSGSEYIEKDKYALLHKGEAVLTAAENETLSALGGVEGAALMAAQKSAPIVMAQEQAAPAAMEVQPQNVNVTVELDGYQMAKVMATATNELNRQLNTRVIK